MHHKRYTSLIVIHRGKMPQYRVKFFTNSAGKEPVRAWLKNLNKEDRRSVGEDVKSLQFRWPLGLPLVRKMAPHLWELRSSIKDGIVRVFFTVWEDAGLIVLLHAFIKKSGKTPQVELATAQKRLKMVQADIREADAEQGRKKK